ncbi:MAG: OOP family OmpA-OmpF porin, partial [Alteromonadaceae bacterium]
YLDPDASRGLHLLGSGDDEEWGFGGAIGYRYNPDWEVRFIANQWDFEGRDNADAYGLDVLYHFTDYHFYGIGGIKHEDIGSSTDDEDGELINLGIGKRFGLTERWSFTAEALATQSLQSNSSNDLIVNLGLTYLFGQKAAKYEATPAPTPAPARLDSDHDGIYDDMDACPNTPMEDAVDGQGCSRYTIEDESVLLSINFANNDDRVAPHYYPEIKRVVDFLSRYPDSSVVIEGHTSVKGGSAYNQNLSEQRAQKVAGIMVSHFNVAKSRVNHIGYGESRLLNKASSKMADQENRRIEARISGSKRVKVKR